MNKILSILLLGCLILTGCFRDSHKDVDAGIDKNRIQERDKGHGQKLLELLRRAGNQPLIGAAESGGDAGIGDDAAEKGAEHEHQQVFADDVVDARAENRDDLVKAQRIGAAEREEPHEKDQCSRADRHRDPAKAEEHEESDGKQDTEQAKINHN